MGSQFGGETMSWSDMNMREFQAALASSTPTPGGGTASALALAQAAALSVMVSKLTLGNDKWSEGWPVAQAVQSLSVPMMNRANVLADDDSDAFDRVMDGFGMPKETPDEKNVRRSAIRAATLTAASVPFETAELGLKLLELLPDLARKGNANAASDVGVAGLLASAAAKGAVFNVEINLDSLPSDMGQDFRVRLPELKERIRTESRNIMDAVRDRMDG
jgi:formiminotetrahydrofolate cyclodeaminase